MHSVLLNLLLLAGLLTAGPSTTQGREDPVKKYEEEVRLHPDSAEAWFRLGEADYGTFGRSKARAAFEKALELRPDYAEAYNGLAWYYLAPSGWGNTIVPREYYEKAIELGTKAIQLKPDLVNAYIGLSIAHRVLEHYEEAADALEQATRLDSEDISSRFDLAEIYAKQGRFEKAIEIFQALMARKPHEELRHSDFARFDDERYCVYAAYHHTASLYRKMGRYSDALEIYRQVISTGIDSADTHYGLGLTYAALGYGQAALAEHAILKDRARAEHLDVMRSIIEKDADDLLRQINQ